MYLYVYVSQLSRFYWLHCRGSKRRLKWFLLHWILGTIVSIVGIINVYTGIRAYQKKTLSSRDSSLWTILFTAQVSCLVLFYLFQDKWEHFQKQRVVLDELDHHQSNNPNRRSSDQIIQVETRNDHEQKVMVPQPCRKSNALVNLFKLIWLVWRWSIIYIRIWFFCFRCDPIYIFGFWSKMWSQYHFLFLFLHLVYDRYCWILLRYFVW